MTQRGTTNDAHDIQRAADNVAALAAKERPEAFETFAASILKHFTYPYDSNESPNLFSLELPLNIQRFAAVWLLRILTRSPMSLQFNETERHAAALFDRVFERQIYPRVGIESKDQTYQKLSVLTDFLKQEINGAIDLAADVRDIQRIPALRQEVIRKFNDKNIGPLLAPLLSPQLITRNRLNNLFESVIEYAINEDGDRMYTRNAACVSCDEFRDDAWSYGSRDSREILGELASQLKTTVNRHFDSLESSQQPVVSLEPIDKRYPLATPDTSIGIKIRIANGGSGAARDLRIDGIESDHNVCITTHDATFGTLGAGDAIVFDIRANLIEVSEELTLLVSLSWLRLGGRQSDDFMFVVKGQKEGFDWDQLSLEEPYSLEPVTAESDLVGRRSELRQLHRLANRKAIGSGFIYGQRRVGKTSLANVLAVNLQASVSPLWLVVSKGSGDYVASTARATLRNLGVLLVEEMKLRLHDVAHLPSPEFGQGLAPLSAFIDRVLAVSGRRLLIILDEFDELPLDLLRRSELSASLFQPLRQISNKSSCGVILVGGEGMQRIMNIQGDRLNKFRSVEVGYFDKSDSWDDFAELVRRPVAEWLAISDGALSEVHRMTAGNPYFAKLIANQLFIDLVELRHSHASEIDMQDAIRKTVESIGSNAFAHFWTDGLVEEDANAEAARALRRQVLMALGRLARDQRVISGEMIWGQLTGDLGVDITVESLRLILQDFVSRGVLVEDSDGSYRARIPLFQMWLAGNGVIALLDDAPGLAAVNAQLRSDEEARVADSEIAALCDRWEHFRYRGRALDPIRCRDWLTQFGSSRAQRLMFRILENVRLYNEDMLRRKMREAFGIIARDMGDTTARRSRVRRDILVSTLDESPAKGGLSYCRLFASENRIFARHVLSIERARGLRDVNAGVEKLILIDDFAGTGRSLERGLERQRELLEEAKRAGVGVVICCLVGFGDARSRVERFIARCKLDAVVYICEELGSEHKAFSPQSRMFSFEAERTAAKEIAESIGIKLDRRQPLGYGALASLVVFAESCPNNTLPIVWAQTDKWKPLFPRF